MNTAPAFANVDSVMSGAPTSSAPPSYATDRPKCAPALGDGASVCTQLQVVPERENTSTLPTSTSPPEPSASGQPTIATFPRIAVATPHASLAKSSAIGSARIDETVVRNGSTRTG